MRKSKTGFICIPLSSTVNFTAIDRFRKDLKTKAFLKSVNEKIKKFILF